MRFDYEHTITLDPGGPEVDVVFNAHFEPAEGDGWNSPRLCAAWVIDEVETADGDDVELTDHAAAQLVAFCEALDSEPCYDED